MAATLGHDIEVPLARIHAAPVSVEIKKPLFAELREHPFAPSAEEALEESILSRDVADVQASLEAWNRVRGPLEEGLSRIHRQLESAVYASPELMHRLSGKEGGSDGVTQYVDAHMQVIRRLAWYLSTVTPDAETILNRLDIQSLVSDIEHGRLTSPADREKRLSGALTDFDEPEGSGAQGTVSLNHGVPFTKEVSPEEKLNAEVAVWEKLVDGLKRKPSKINLCCHRHRW